MTEARAAVREGGAVEPLREIPALRRPRTWKDEVRERVTERRRQRAYVRNPEAPPDSFLVDPIDDVPLRPVADEEPFPAADAQRETGNPLEVIELGEPLIEDLPPSPVLDASPERPRGPASRWTLDGDPTLGEPAGASEWVMETPENEDPVEPLERPAYFVERFHAAAVDLGLLACLFLIVVYFAARVAHVGVAGLRPTWPYLGAYLVFLGLAYAVYFTGTCGRTLGKILCGLWVVDVSGRPPGYARALGRAVVATLGVALAGLGLAPIFFDPARRALHDRLFRTRVVRL